MLCWLPNADPATRTEGGEFTARAVELYANHVPKTQRGNVTIAVSRIDYKGTQIEVAMVWHPDLRTADRIAGRLRKAGVDARGTTGDLHAEVALDQVAPGRTIGLSNPKGPCFACRRHFGSSAPVYWDDEAWIP
jgi:hypothetical protein